MNSTSDRLLRLALQGNAAFSTLCGLVLLSGAGALAAPLGVPALALRLVGLSLLPFALGLWANARRPLVRRGEAWLAVGLDLGWVVGTGALVGLELWPLTSMGRWSAIGVGEVVLSCALLQAWGLRRARRPVPHASGTSATRDARVHGL